MISNFAEGKMLGNIVLLFFIASVYGSGEFSVLNSPKTISFGGVEPLHSQYVGDVLYAALGNAVASNSAWSGLTINDPFNLAKGVVAIYIDGVTQMSTSANAKTYELIGSNAEDSLNAISAQLEATNEPICDINFEQHEQGLEDFKTCFGSVPTIHTLNETKNLNSALHTADKQFLQEVAYIEAAANNFANNIKAANFLLIRMSLVNVAKAHGTKSEAVAEAKKLLSNAIGRLLTAAQNSNDSVLFVQLTHLAPGRSKREILQPSKENPLNLAEFYSEDYPVIFNIILWFMVVFAFSLLAICYAIGTMDPGRDSIIYRMTSNRIKKDN